MAQLTYNNDKTLNNQPVQGSDGRLNVSSRADGRGYYNSRDESESYILLFNDASATGSTNDVIVHLQNKKTDGKHMVIRSIGINSTSASGWDVVTVTGTAGGGAVAATPVNLNQAGVAKTAAVTANTVVSSNSSPITSIVTVDEIDHITLGANGHEEFRFQDQLRLGQDQAIAIRCKTGTDVLGFGVIFFYFE